MNKWATGIVLVGILCVIGFSCSSGKTDPVTDQMLYALLEGKDYFRLRDKMAETKDKLSQERTMYYQAMLDHAFNRCEESNTRIEQLLGMPSVHKVDSLVSELLQVKVGNLTRMNRYRETSITLRQLIEMTDPVADSSDYADFVNMEGLWSAVAEVPPTEIHKHGNVEIDSYRDSHDMLMVPVRSGGAADEFVFDTGAGLSTVTESVARTMGMTLYDTDVEAGTTGEKIRTKLAVADSIYLGDLLVENVLFLMVPDEALSFPEANFEIRGIIGFPVMLAMEEIHMQKNGKLSIPGEPGQRNFSNLYLETLSPSVQLISGPDSLIFTLDTGATQTEISKRYYDNHKERIDATGRRSTSRRGYVGGIREVEEIILENFPFRIGSKEGVLPEATVVMEEFSFLENSDGNLGQDVFSQFDVMILNFRSMYVDFESYSKSN